MTKTMEGIAILLLIIAVAVAIAWQVNASLVKSERQECQEWAGQELSGWRAAQCQAVGN